MQHILVHSKMNGLRPLLTAPLVFAFRQLRGELNHVNEGTWVDYDSQLDKVLSGAPGVTLNKTYPKSWSATTNVGVGITKSEISTQVGFSITDPDIMNIGSHVVLTVTLSLLSFSGQTAGLKSDPTAWYTLPLPHWFRF